MKGMMVIFRREMKEYLISPIAAITVIAFLCLSGGLFMSQFFLLRLLDMRGWFSLLPFILAVVLPAVSMRLWAEDRQLNTLELLLSLPLKPIGLVLGKFLAALAFLVLLLASSWPIPAMLRMLGQPDFGPIASGYIGVLLLGGLFLAIGIFISGFCRDQIVAFILGLFACLGLFLIGTDFIAATLDGWWPGLGGFLQSYLGVARHSAGFEKGVVDVRDTAYFLFLTAAFLFLNGIWMEGRLRPRAKAAFATACGLMLGIAMAAQAVLEVLPLGRFDWTAAGTYTISPSSREILRGLEVPATVKLYLSRPDKMPTAMRTMERDLKDSLEEMRLASGGRLKVQVFHMEATAPLEGTGQQKEEESSLKQKLGSRGIRPFQVQSIEADEVGVRLIYAAASIAYKDRPEEVIPQLVPGVLDQLEYLVVSKIYQLAQAEPPLVAVRIPTAQSTLGAMGRGADVPYLYLPSILQAEGYAARRVEIAESDPIPPDARALVIVEPGEMNDRQRYETARYLVEGGALFLAAQRFRYDYVREEQGIFPTPRQHVVGLDSLLERWGVSISPDILLDEQSQILSTSSGARIGPFEVTIPVKAPIHVVVGQQQFNTDLGLVNRLPPIFYLWGSPLELDEQKFKESNLTHTVLFTSSPRSWKVPRGEYFSFLPSGAAERHGKGSFPLAALVTGTFPDPYAGQPVPEWPTLQIEGEQQEQEKKEPAGPVSTLTPKPGQLILVGCDEMFKEHLIESGGQLLFLLNALDTLVSGGKLVNIRNKQQTVRVFASPSPAEKAWFRFFTLGLMPIAVVLLSVGSAAWRRRLREAAA